MTLGGRRVQAARPRVRSVDGEKEVPLATYRHFADRDPLSRLVLEQMLAGVSTRRFERTREPVGSELEAAAPSTSRSAVSREFVVRTRESLIALMSRRLDDVRLAVLMLDGIELKSRCCVVALGITSDGVKIPLGLWDGSTENATVARELLSNLVARGLDTGQGVLCVIDGAKALRKAIDEVLGPVPVQRCVRRKERNVLDHLPERDRPSVKRRLRQAWARDDHERALAELRSLASELERSHPGAAASLREGMAETLTVTRLGITGSLKRTLQSTNPCESLIEIVRRTSRNVKHWQSGDMCLRWTAAGMLEAERQFRKIIGYRDLARLALARPPPSPDPGGAAPTRMRQPITGPPPKFHGARDILWKCVQRDCVRKLTTPRPRHSVQEDLACLSPKDRARSVALRIPRQRSRLAHGMSVVTSGGRVASLSFASAAEMCRSSLSSPFAGASAGGCRGASGLRRIVRGDRFTKRVISGDRAREIEERLGELLDVEIGELRDYLRGNIGESATRRTGFRLIRGTHGGQYVRDPQGTDILPARVSVPG